MTTPPPTVTADQADVVDKPSNPKRDRGRAICQYARAWPKTDAGWKNIPYLSPQKGDEGSGHIMGSMTLLRRYGVIKRADQRRWLNYPPSMDDRTAGTQARLDGCYCRVLVTDEDGGVSIGQEIFAPIWWGVFGDDDDSFGNQKENITSGDQVILARGLLDILDDIYPDRGYAISTLGTAGGDPGFLPVFNGGSCADGSTQIMGNRYATQFLLDKRQTYIFDLSSNLKWTALQAVEHLLNAYVNLRGRTLDWTVAAEGGADIEQLLGFSDRWDLRGLSILAGLTQIINSRRGLSFRLKVVGANAQLIVQSAFATALDVGTLTIPANSAQFDLDVRDKPWISSPRITRNSRNLYDILRVEGDPEITVHTLNFRPDKPRVTDSGHGDLVLGHAVLTEQAYDAATVTGRHSPIFEDVWRRIDLASDWLGHPQFGESDLFGLANYRTTTTSALHGVKGETGLNRAQGGALGTVLPPRGFLRFEKNLPMFAGFDYYITTNPADFDLIDRTLAVVPPLIFYRPSETAPWQDISDKFQLTVIENRPTILWGRSGGADKRAVQAILQASDTVLFTLALAGPLALRVSWVRTPSEMPRQDSPRSITLRAKGMQKWRLVRGTVCSLDDDGQLREIFDDRVIRDDTPQLKELLAFARPWYTEPKITVSWDENGVIDHADGEHPGAMCANVIRGDKTIATNSIITRRSWDFVNWRTTKTTDRPNVDLGCIL